MCLHKSGVVVRIDESEIRVYSLPKDDSHNNIRATFHLSDGPLADWTASVECVPVRGLSNPDHYDFRFDAERPEWWTDGMTDQAKRELFRASQDELEGEWTNPLHLDELRDARGLKRLTKTRDLYLSSLNSLDAGALPALAQTGCLYLTSLNTAAKMALRYRIASRGKVKA